MPIPMRSYKNIIAGVAEAKLAEKQALQLSEIANTLITKTLELEKERKAALSALAILDQETKNEEQVNRRITLHRHVQVLSIKIDRLTGAKSNAIHKLELCLKVVAEKRNKVNELNSIATPADEQVSEPVATQPVEKLQSNLSKLEKDLRTALTIGNKSKFLALINGNSNLIHDLQTFCINKPRLLPRLKEYLKELEISVVAATPVRRFS